MQNLQIKIQAVRSKLCAEECRSPLHQTTHASDRTGGQANLNSTLMNEFEALNIKHVSCL